MFSITFIFVSLFASISGEPMSIMGVIGSKQARLEFYHKGSHSKTYELGAAPAVLQNSKFIFPETHCYIHGYNEGPRNESVQLIVDAYSNREINLLVIDWSSLVSESYLSAVMNMMQIGPVLSKMFVNLFEAGLPKESFTLVGHSLGGQLAGYIGRNYIQQTGEKLPTIWTLDPAFPGFLPTQVGTFFKSIGKNDADFIAIIHTGIPNFGQAAPRGHVDFYPNGGLQGQPGCPSGIIVPFSEDDLCSHQRSWRFWAESVKVTTDPRFYSFPAISYVAFRELGIGSLQDKAIIMGMECPKTARGTYYLRTNAEPPYAKGFDGY